MMRYLNFALAPLVLACTLANVHAAGMQPQASVVVIEEADGEGSVDIKNTDPHTSILLTAIENIPEDTDDLLAILPPMARVDAGKTQRIRFVLTSKTPLTTERLKRVTFEGVPPKSAGDSKVRVTFIQNLPLIIRPAGLEKDLTPWKNLKWTLGQNGLEVKNPSPYVVRLGQGVQTIPDNTSWLLPKAYILPGESIKVALKDKSNSGERKYVRISPATTWGFTVDSYDAPVTAQ